MPETSEEGVRSPALESVMKTCSAWRSYLNIYLKKASDLKIGVSPLTPIASPNVIRPDILVANRSLLEFKDKGLIQSNNMIFVSQDIIFYAVTVL